MKLQMLTPEQINSITLPISMQQLIHSQKNSLYGTKALDSIIIKNINKTSNTINVTIQRLNSDFDDLNNQPTKRQSFKGRVNDNLIQLFPNYTLDIEWLSNYDEPFNYKITPNKGS